LLLLLHGVATLESHLLVLHLEVYHHVVLIFRITSIRSNIVDLVLRLENLLVLELMIFFALISFSLLAVGLLLLHR